MADEISVTSRLQIKNECEVRRSISTSFDQSAVGYISNVQTIGLTPEALELGDISVLGWGWFHNLDDSNFVQLGALDSGAVFIPFIEIEAGQPSGPFKLATNAPYAKADDAASAAAPVQLEYIIGED